MIGFNNNYLNSAAMGNPYQIAQYGNAPYVQTVQTDQASNSPFISTNKKETNKSDSSPATIMGIGALLALGGVFLMKDKILGNIKVRDILDKIKNHASNAMTLFNQFIGGHQKVIAHPKLQMALNNNNLS